MTKFVNTPGAGPRRTVSRALVARTLVPRTLAPRSLTPRVLAQTKIQTKEA
ncbi:hypothetical protein [Nonomuraea soli]|uniref:Uncharacterized protein n=1 Tax=Nonomuraea soli TaxID=1032476 RepID=A0A7W0CEP4_9ACTN|nr:hypothetical protein [Nonomuraea soli]MBA2889791.1 hypothetical protein [Nonomuraea soli]